MPKYLTFIALVLLVPFSALAVDIPSSVDTGRINEQINNKIQKQKFEELSAPAKPQFASQAPEGAEFVFFKLTDLKVQGVTIYSPLEIRKIYEHDLGKEITLKRLFEIADEITQKYRKDGYILSRAGVPAQEVGEVPVINVVEGYIHEIKINSILPVPELIENYKTKLLSKRPIDASTLERYVLLLNDLSGVDVRSVITPIEDDSAPAGAVNMELIISKEDYTHNLSFDNFGSRYLGPHQSSIQVGSYDNILDYDNASFSGGTSLPSGELSYKSIYYSFPVGAEGLKIGASAVTSKTKPSYTLTISEIEGESDTYNIFAEYPLIRSRAENLILKAGFDVKNSLTNSFGARLIEDRIRVLNIEASYEFADEFAGNNRLNLEISRGLNIFGARKSGSEDLSREEGRSDFEKVNANYSRSQNLTSGFDAYLAIAGQYTNSPLLSAEEFGYGGQSYGRAYDSSEISGDHGIAGTIELRYHEIPEFYNFETQPFVFYDFGKVWDIDELTKNQESASSIGFGFRTSYNNFVNTSLSFAYPLTKEISTPIYNQDDYRFGWSVEFLY